MLILGNACLVAEGDTTEEFGYHVFICVVGPGENHLCFLVMVFGCEFELVWQIFERIFILKCIII